MLQKLRQLSGTNVAIAVLNVSFLTGAGLACWQAWADGAASTELAVRSSVARTTAPQLLSASVSLDAEAVPLAQSPSHGPTGTWRRISSPAKITLQFDQRRVSGIYQSEINGHNLLVSFAGDYRWAGENLLYGVIQEAGVRQTENFVPQEASRLIDQPFSVRYELTNHGLQIVDVKFAGVGLRTIEEPIEQAFSHFVGGYDRVADNG